MFLYNELVSSISENALYSISGNILDQRNINNSLNELYLDSGKYCSKWRGKFISIKQKLFQYRQEITSISFRRYNVLASWTNFINVLTKCSQYLRWIFSIQKVLQYCLQANYIRFVNYFGTISYLKYSCIINWFLGKIT